MGKIAVIFGMQRCGSNFFLSACRRFEDLTVFGEMYHGDGAFPFQEDDAEDFAIKQKLAAFILERFSDDEVPLLETLDPASLYTAETDAAINKGLAQFTHEYPSQ